VEQAGSPAPGIVSSADSVFPRSVDGTWKRVILVVCPRILEFRYPGERVSRSDHKNQGK